MTLKQSQRFSEDELKAISDGFEDKHPQEIIEWAFDTFGVSNVAVGSSFGGASGAVLVDLVAKIAPYANVFYLDTDFLFPETYALVEETRQRYGIEPIAVKSIHTPEQQAEQIGPELWVTNPDACCNLRKVEPNVRMLAGAEAWVTGIRRDQSGRQDVPIVEWNSKFWLVKVNAVAHWTKKDIWGYILKNDVPYNKLLDQGYKSIGCTHCTRPVATDEDERAGRWSGQGKTECGLHT